MTEIVLRIRGNLEMMRVTDKRDGPRTWSSASTMILVAFVVIGTIEAGAHEAAGAAVCFGLAVIYPPLRILRGRLAGRRDRP
jgi:hypothetical protein